MSRVPAGGNRRTWTCTYKCSCGHVWSQGSPEDLLPDQSPDIINRLIAHNSTAPRSAARRFSFSVAAKRILALKRRPCPRTHRLSPPGVDSVTISFRRHSWHIQTHFHWTKQSFFGAKSISIQLPAAQRLLVRPHNVRNALVTTRIGDRISEVGSAPRT